MLKLDNPQDLAKAGQALGSLFARQAASLEKSYELNKASATRHVEAEKRHRAAADVHEKFAKHSQEQADGMDNDHEMKAHLVESAKLARAQADIEKAFADAEHADSIDFQSQADSLKADMDSMKSMASEWGATVTITKTAGAPVAAAAAAAAGAAAGGNLTGVEAMLQETTATLVKRTLDSFENDPTVAETIREVVIKRVQEALGDQVQPTRVNGIMPGYPQGVRPVFRPGQEPVGGGAPKVQSEFADLVKLDDY